MFRLNNHPNRTPLPYKVYPKGRQAVGAFKHEDDALEFACKESKLCKIVYIVKRNSETIRGYFLGREFNDG